jgi:hypothetical protein
MDEIFQKLVDSELLSEETKAQLTEQWQAHVETFKTQVREEVSLQVRAELSEQWIAERDELVNKVDTLVSQVLEQELGELHADIEHHRDLEAQYAEKLVEEKHRLAEEVAKELDGLVDKLDQFLEMRLEEEFDELKEEIEVVKQNEFGRKIYEAFASTFAETHVDEKSATSKLSIAESKISDLEKQLASAEESQNALVRESKMKDLLSNLAGKKREQMEMVLKSVPTDRLDESYKFFIGRMIKEDVAAPAATLTEGATGGKTTVVTGDAAHVVEQTTSVDPLNEELAQLRRAAGIKH